MPFTVSSRARRSCGSTSVPSPSFAKALNGTETKEGPVSADAATEAVMPSSTRSSFGRLMRTAKVRERGSALPATQATSPDDPACNCITALMEALDSYIPEPVRILDQAFMMPIEDVFSIEGRGTVVTGRVERGIIKVNEPVEIVGIRPTQSTVVTGVEMFRKLLESGQAGDNIGCLLRSIKKEDVERGQVLAKPGSITPHTEFQGEVYVLSKEEGGRHTPFFKGYRPQFYIRTTDVTGDITLPVCVEMVMPGDNVSVRVKLIQPIAMEEKMRFAIREGGRTVGAGTVSKIYA